MYLTEPGTALPITDGGEIRPYCTFGQFTQIAMIVNVADAFLN